MTTWQRLWRVQLTGLLGLLVFAGGLSVLLLVEDLFFPSGEDVSDVFLLAFGLTFFYGTLPVLMLGAPVYVAVTKSGRFHWLPLLVAALLPGAALFAINPGVGVVGMVAGVFVSGFTHGIAARWARAR